MDRTSLKRGFLRHRAWSWPQQMNIQIFGKSGPRTRTGTVGLGSYLLAGGHEYGTSPEYRKAGSRMSCVIRGMLLGPSTK
jgi:hypothetical protein